MTGDRDNKPELTLAQVRELIRIQSAESLNRPNGHQITLEQMLVPPQRILVFARQVQGGKTKDQELSVWLVGKERSDDGYGIILSDDGLQFGLASPGFPTDKHLILVGWYGDLLSAFLNM